MKFIKIIFLNLLLLILVWSGISPKDRFTWFMEVFPVFIGLPILIYYDKKLNLNKYLFITFCIHGVILLVGGKYTYAEVPIGFWFQNLFDLSRNHYDRLGHFFQGVSPALISYFVLRKNKIINQNIWLKVISVSLALSFSVFYEFLEWWTALLTGDSAEAFLGTQGDPWDTQWDMFMAFCGASVGMAIIKVFDET